MKASISFPELQDLIAAKTKQPLSLAFIDEKTVKVGYPLNLGFIKKDIFANLVIQEWSGTDLRLQLDAGFGSDTMLTTVLGLMKGRIPEGLIEKQPDSHILLHLGQIEKLKGFFEKVDVNSLLVRDEGLEAEGRLK